MPGFPVVQFIINVVAVGFGAAVLDFFVGTHLGIIIPLFASTGLFSTYGAGSSDIIGYGAMAFPLVGFVILSIAMFIKMSSSTGGI